jgi:hypothetical protein
LLSRVAPPPRDAHHATAVIGVEAVVVNSSHRSTLPPPRYALFRGYTQRVSAATGRSAFWSSILVCKLTYRNQPTVNRIRDIPLRMSSEMESRTQD